jgi:adenine-specific DNA-methyltransferase
MDTVASAAVMKPAARAHFDGEDVQLVLFEETKKNVIPASSTENGAEDGREEVKPTCPGNTGVRAEWKPRRVRPVEDHSSADTAELRKARGAFFTPPEIGFFLAHWAVRAAADSVFEPSCGEAGLLLAAAKELRRLSASELSLGRLFGVDIHEPSIRAAHVHLAGTGLAFELQTRDFFDIPALPQWDVVIGNPPYLRYQAFSGSNRLKAQEAALRHGVRLGGLANAWAAFVVHAAQCLNPKGRLALVLPAALLSVNYAAPVRRFLLKRFSSVQIIMFEERVFPGVLEEVVLLLAEGTGPTEKFELFQVRDVEELLSWDGLPGEKARECAPANAEAKWTDALLPKEAIALYHQLHEKHFEPLLEWGETELGMVTGNNRYFTLSSTEAAAQGLASRELLKISPPGSRHLRGLEFSEAAFRELAGEGARAYLFYPPAGKTLSPAAADYIAQGEHAKVHKAYKCSVREPWWRVPLVAPPDLFLTYMNQDLPRLVANEARVHYLNSVHGVTLRRGRTKIGRDLLPVAMLNSLTALGAELEGRSYGGGILKVEPKEADRLPMPSLDLVTRAADDLRALLPQLGKHLRSSHLEKVLDSVDSILLVKHLGLRSRQVQALRASHKAMAARRNARGGKPA